ADVAHDLISYPDQRLDMRHGHMVTVQSIDRVTSRRLGQYYSLVYQAGQHLADALIAATAQATMDLCRRASCGCGRKHLQHPSIESGCDGCEREGQVHTTNIQL